MKSQKTAWARQRLLILVTGCALIIVTLLMSAQASPSPTTLSLRCANPQISLGALYGVPSFSTSPWGLREGSYEAEPAARLQCLAQEPTEGEIFKISHKISELLRYTEASESRSTAQGQEYVLKLSEGVELLASQISLKKALVRTLLDAQGQPYPPALLEALNSHERLVLRIGDIASLAARVDFMTNLMQYLVHNLMNSDVPLPTTQDDITLVFNLNGGLAAVDIATVLQGAPIAGMDPLTASQLDIRQITVKISNGTITSEADLNPADFSLTRGQLEVQFRLGPNSITSTAIFSKGEDGAKEALIITAQVGALNLTGEATFSSGAPQFKLAASLYGLLSVSALFTPEGFTQPTFQVELKF